MTGVLWLGDEAEARGSKSSLELDVTDQVYRELPKDSSLKQAIRNALDKRCPHCHKGHLEEWCENPIPARYVGLTGDSEAICIRCNLYRCTYCGTRLARFHRRIISEGAEQWIEAKDVHAYGFTQTVAPHVDEEWRFENGEAHKQLTEAWEKHRRILTKQGTQVLAYVVVAEANKSGYIHWHGIVVTDRPLKKCSGASRGGYNRWAKAKGRPTARPGQCVCILRRSNPEHCFQQTAWEAGLGINDLKPLRSAKAMSRYVTKKISDYVLKGVGSETRWPRYARRVRYSRRFSPLSMRQLRELARTKVEEKLKEQGEWVDRSEGSFECLFELRPAYAEVRRRRLDRLRAATQPEPAGI